jgi:hypothetical protein
MYSLVVNERFFITLSAIPGIILMGGDYHIDHREFLKPASSLKFKTMNALGYNSRRWYGGIEFIGDTFIARLDKQENVNIGHAKGKIYVGYRFIGK